MSFIRGLALALSTAKTEEKREIVRNRASFVLTFCIVKGWGSPDRCNKKQLEMIQIQEGFKNPRRIPQRIM